LSTSTLGLLGCPSAPLPIKEHNSYSSQSIDDQ
jgi:hypothetical protein